MSLHYQTTTSSKHLTQHPPQITTPHHSFVTSALFDTTYTQQLTQPVSDMVCLTRYLLGAAGLALAAAQNSTAPPPGDGPRNPMLQLSADPSFHYEILRTLSLSVAEGADLGEVLVAAAQVRPSDFESYYAAFADLAERVDAQGKAIDAAKYPVSARAARLKAASYFRAADFFLHGDWADPRIDSLWAKQTAAFDDALPLMDRPGRRTTLDSADGSFKIPAIFYAAAGSGRRPTILMCNGFDGAQEEMFHVLGKAALDRGYNVITFEGPGQPTVRREQGVGFIPDWERATSPVVDHALTLEEVDPEAIGLVGYSLGGYLASRAAAFEPRIAAVGAIDGIFDFGATFTDQLPPIAKQWLKAGKRQEFNDLFAQAMGDPSTPTGIRWAVQQGRWSFKAADFFDFATEVQRYTLEGVADKIKQPLFIGDAELDMFFPGQPKQLAEAATGSSNKVVHHFKAAEGSGEHCSVGAAVYQNQLLFDWFEDVFQGRKQ
ncbi:dipeptidyl aminopeptidase/acylaminoacyl-peptidase related protein [Cordyceps fumosorosea ARSEF 2679]|uniref:Dipeptidyl aminopeptidase/acylaminoacyl-peptidase related protein n=1 Tax=Cordyceps fumosorosea (strain ARSEF 2679) TaxID=1081104 RepID=A0A167LQ57_CORFA|nr:dipeptidyl aminopeptidase/acylaminoacyl-peptidase related protein [Cordyceps fumosorosea ARSEF 2679]OAA53362.1 dipeptidyl aminopeptidase/acylaminoacyl-peptidase related protein [Cordyceps fumosorosea ARSEF 2679]